MAQRVLPFDSGPTDRLDAGWALNHGLIFAASLADGSSGSVTPVGGSKDFTTGKGLTSGLIHCSATPFGKGRNRTDSTSNFIWAHKEADNFTTGDFTAAAFGLPTQVGVVLNWFSNGGGANQWRILTNCDAGIGIAVGSIAFWTYDGAAYVIAAAGAMVTRPAWYIVKRRGTTHEIWRDATLLASGTNTAKDCTGTGTNPPQLGNGTSCTTGLFGPALLWRRAITPTEHLELCRQDPYQFAAKRRRDPIAPHVATSHTSTGALAADPATVAGSAQAVFTSTGALAAQAATVAGAATRTHLFTSSGILVASAATLAGTATRTATSHPSSGVLTAQSATASGAATRLSSRTSSGALASQSATMSGAAARFSAGRLAAGSLSDGSAQVTGFATRRGGGLAVSYLVVG